MFQEREYGLGESESSDSDTNTITDDDNKSLKIEVSKNYTNTLMVVNIVSTNHLGEIPAQRSERGAHHN